MHPEISVEDLTQAEPLLLMLHSRSRHTPATFASHDRNFKEVRRNTQIISPGWLYGCIILLRDDAYGSLQPHTGDS